MAWRHGWMIGLVLAAALTAGGCRKESAPTPEGAGASSAAASGAYAGIGQPAPTWELKDLDGTVVRLSDFREKQGVILVFFGTWCAACMEDVPKLIALQDQLQGRNVKLLAISVEETAAKLKRFREQRGVNYPLLLDEDGAVGRQYKLFAVPRIVGVDRRGIVRHDDYVLPGDIEALLKELSN